MPTCRTRRIIITLACGLLLLGCPKEEPGPSITALTSLAPGADCADGGIRIDTGEDLDGDGLLSADEILDSEFVCNGADGSDGVAGGDGEDGIDGEDGTDGEDGEDGVFFRPGDIEPPLVPEGVYTVGAIGGEGATGSGGHGGDFILELDYGSYGGHVKVFATGQADASFMFPLAVPVWLGLTPLDVITDMTMPVLPAGDHTDLVDGDAHMHTGQVGLFAWISATDAPITGVHVAPEATLTLPPNFAVAVSFILENDLHNEGTIVTGLLSDGISRATLDVGMDNFYGAAGSLIDLSGAADSAGQGGQAGNLHFDCDDDQWSTTEDLGSFYNEGAIALRGGAGEIGGSGGNFILDAELRVLNTGALDTSGGIGTVGVGGDAGDIDIDTQYGHNWNAGPVLAMGGDGATFGGDGGGFSLYIGYPGDVRNDADVILRGGDVAESCLLGCGGGDGGDLYYRLYGGGIWHDGLVDASGGFGAGGSGGAGGDIDMDADYDNGWWGNAQPLDDIVISGSLLMDGGAGATGGNAGDLLIQLDADEIPANQEIVLYGYTDIDMSGGSGTSGGDGGSFECTNEYADADVFDYGPSGGCINYANVSSTGGASSGSAGGHGGSFVLETSYDYGYTTEWAISLNAGDLSLTGGSGLTTGGRGGEVTIWGYNHAENRGLVNTDGGPATGPGGNGGHAADSSGVWIISDLGPAINTGEVSVRGGAAEATFGSGGDGGIFELVGWSATNSGAIVTCGGDSNMTDGTGGDADVVNIYGVIDGASNTATLIDVAGGAGATPGASAEVWIDGLNTTGQWLGGN